MKQKANETKRLLRGVPSAVLISALIHCALLAIAGGLVVFTVIKKDEKKFVPPPPVERPKMNLIKPQVKIDKTSRPRSMQRIATTRVSSMSDIALPDVVSAGPGLGGGLGGYELAPDIEGMSLYGGKRSLDIGNDFEGVFYALGVDRNGQRNGLSLSDYNGVLGRFFRSGWNDLAFSKYYRAPQKLYTTFFYIPMSPAEGVPRSFGVSDDVYTYQWVVHYKGRIMSKRDGTFRFWGRGDNVLAVRLDGKEVLQAGHPAPTLIISDWRGSAKEHRKYYRGHGLMGVGDWFELKAGVPVEMEVVFGDPDGHWSQATLTIEDKDADYVKNRDGYPVLPVFKTSEIPEYLIDMIYVTMIDGEADLHAPLMFNVY